MKVTPSFFTTPPHVFNRWILLETWVLSQSDNVLYFAACEKVALNPSKINLNHEHVRR